MINRRTRPWREKWKALLRPSWIMGSTVVPVVFFGLALLGVMTQDTAMRATVYTLLAVLLSFGFIARRLSGGGMISSLVAGAVVALLGYGVVQLKLWTKYIPAIGY